MSAAQTTSPTAPPVRLSWKGKLFLLFFGIVLMCVTLEIALRVAAAVEARRPRPDLNAPATSSGKFWAIYDPDLGYRQNPYYGDMNSEGLRNPPIGPKAGRFRVLILGDSVAVYGDTLEDTFVGHMRSELKKTSTYSQVELIDAGIKGYTNYQELLYLKKFGVRFEPDLVGVEFCLNDLHKILQSFRVQNGEIVPGTYEFASDALSESTGLPARLARQSYLFVWMRSKSRIAWSVLRWKLSGGFSFDYKLDIQTAWQDDQWPIIESQLREMADIGRRNRFSVFLTVFPVAAQYDAAYLARDRDYVLKPQRRLKEICARLEIPFYDLYPDLNSSMFIEDGIHLTREGRIRAGLRLAEFLKGASLLPAAEAAGVPK